MKNETIFIYLKVGVPSKNAADFEALMNDLVAVVQTEPGTLVYEWYSVADGDGETWHILERYANAADGDKHVKGFAENFAGRFFELVDGCEAVVFVGRAGAGGDRRVRPLERGRRGDRHAPSAPPGHRQGRGSEKDGRRNFRQKNGAVRRAGRTHAPV